MKFTLRALLCFFMLVAGLPAFAISIDWSGTYRFEYTEVDSTTLSDPKERKSYLLHNLTLSPKIIAVDGMNIIGQFQILSNPQYPGSQVGQPLGLGANRGTAASMNGDTSNVMSQQQGGSSIEVRQLYLSINQEYGQIILGRAPIHFGLGITHNAGRGAFDHWGDTHDLLAYRMMSGNLVIAPMIGKPYDWSVAQGRDVTDQMIEFTYDNPETRSKAGYFYQHRVGNSTANDAPNAIGGTATSNYSVKSSNLILSRGWDSFTFDLEAGFQEGNTGVVTAGQEVKVSGYGIVTQLGFPRPDGNWNWNVKAGIVSGDDPSTVNFEGYALDRNYDLSFLMFNHPLGGYDVLSTRFQRQKTVGCTTPICPTARNEESLDEEAVSNVVFINPTFNYKLTDKWTWRNSLVYAQLVRNSSTVAGNTVAKDLGFELDSAFVFSPHERVQWVNEVGFLSPGAAWKEGSVNRDNNFTYGFQSKLSVSF